MLVLGWATSEASWGTHWRGFMNTYDPHLPITDSGPCAVGIVGLGVMGANLARNLATNLDDPVAVYDLNPASVNQLIVEHPELPLIGFTDLAEFAASLRAPSVILLMVPAGLPVDSAGRALLPYLKPGDILIDGGNSHYRDTERRIGEWAQAGVRFLGMGTSGGEQGALHGPSLMPGGDPGVWETISPVFEPIAAKALDGTPCVMLVGSGASGHFTKMIHNGIEYADLQLIAEVYTLLRAGGLSVEEVAEAFSEWNTGVDHSYLLDATVQVLSTADPLGDGALIELVSDQAKGKGTGAWTVIAAAELGVSASIVAEALFGRSFSSASSERIAWKQLGASAIDSVDLTPNTVGKAYMAARLFAYQQGLSLLHAGSAEYGWDVNLAEVVGIWRAGCIIQAGFLDTLREHYAKSADPVFLTSSPFSEQIVGAASSLQQTVAQASMAGVPTPALSAALNYLAMARSDQLPTALVQLLRDHFGSHTFERIDRPGSFHLQWERDAPKKKL